MHAPLLALLLVTAPCLAVAQTLHGKVILGPRETDPPLGNVRLSVPGYTTQLSDAETGTFTLQLPGLQPGDQIPLSIQKANHAVINQQVLRPYLPRNPLDELVIHMAPMAQRDQMAIDYYQIRIEQKIDADFQQALTAEVGKRVSQLDSDRIKLLVEERDVALAQATQMAKALAMVDLDQASDLYQRAFAFFPDQIDSVLQILEESLLDAELQKALTIIEKAETSRSQVVESYMLRARAFILERKFLLAQRNFQKAIDADSTHVQHLADFATYLGQQNQDAQAKNLLERALRHVQGQDMRAYLLNKLGTTHRNLNHYPEAIEKLHMSLAIYRQLEEKHPSQFASALSHTLNNLGVTLSDVGEHDQALVAQEEALTLTRQLTQLDSQRFEPDLANSLNNIGTTYQSLNRYPQTVSAYEEAVNRYRHLLDQDQRWEPKLAESLSNLGSAYRDLGQLSDAMSTYEEVLERYQRLAQQNAQRFEPMVARTYNNLGVILDESERFPEAINAYKQAAAIRKRLAQDMPERYGPEVAKTVCNLGILYSRMGQLEEAVAAYEEGVAIFEQVAKETPERFEPELAKNYVNLGIGLTWVHRGQEAVEMQQQALDIYRRLAEENPDQYDADVSKTLVNLGLAYAGIHQYPQARTAYEESLTISQRLAELNRDRFQLEVIFPLINLVELSQQELKRSGASQQIEGGLLYAAQVDSALSLLPDMPFRQYIHDLNQELIHYFQQVDLREVGLLIPAVRTIDSLAICDSLPEQVRLQQRIVSVYDDILETYPQAPTVQDSLEQGLGQLAHWQILSQEFREAEVSARRCFDNDPNSVIGVRWLAPALLFQGQFASAKQHYLDHAARAWVMDASSSFADIFLSDLQELDMQGITHPDVPKIRAMLRK